METVVLPNYITDLHFDIAVWIFTIFRNAISKEFRLRHQAGWEETGATCPDYLVSRCGTIVDSAMRFSERRYCSILSAACVPACAVIDDSAEDYAPGMLSDASGLPLRHTHIIAQTE